uniref:Uncharacterized protein n=1 Tax=Oryza rufipogon TaxID=4529 RepID=A0A0E0NDE9_ORYRU
MESEGAGRQLPDAGSGDGRFWARGRRFCDLEAKAIPFLWSAVREVPVARLAAASRNGRRRRPWRQRLRRTPGRAAAW